MTSQMVQACESRRPARIGAGVVKRMGKGELAALARSRSGISASAGAASVRVARPVSHWR